MQKKTWLLLFIIVGLAACVVYLAVPSVNATINGFLGETIVPGAQTIGNSITNNPTFKTFVYPGNTLMGLIYALPLIFVAYKLAGQVRTKWRYFRVSSAPSAERTPIERPSSVGLPTPATPVESNPLPATVLAKEEIAKSELETEEK